MTTFENEFRKFPSLARLTRGMIVTEKIDGTNALVFVSDDGQVQAGSRTRWITPEDDNFGFARWVKEHEDELRTLGPGYHYGEWWGKGIQRGYGLDEKRFSLFNTSLWCDAKGLRPACCHVVPVLREWTFDTAVVDEVLGDLARNGSYAAPGFMQPEGVVVFHVHGSHSFKKTLDKNDNHKGA